MRPTFRPESPDPGEALVGPESQVNVTLKEHHSQQGQVCFKWERESPVPGETQVGTTVTSSRLRPRLGDQIHQDQLRPKCGAKLSYAFEAQVVNRLTMSH